MLNLMDGHGSTFMHSSISPWVDKYSPHIFTYSSCVHKRELPACVCLEVPLINEGSWSEGKRSLEWAISPFSCVLNLWQALTRLFTCPPVEAVIGSSSSWLIVRSIYTPFFIIYNFNQNGLVDTLRRFQDNQKYFSYMASCLILTLPVSWPFMNLFYYK